MALKSCDLRRVGGRFWTPVCRNRSYQSPSDLFSLNLRTRAQRYERNVTDFSMGDSKVELSFRTPFLERPILHYLFWFRALTKPGSSAMVQHDEAASPGIGERRIQKQYAECEDQSKQYVHQLLKKRRILVQGGRIDPAQVDAAPARTRESVLGLGRQSAEHGVQVVRKPRCHRRPRRATGHLYASTHRARALPGLAQASGVRAAGRQGGLCRLTWRLPASSSTQGPR